MKFAVLGLALVAIIGCANCATLSDEQKTAVDESFKYWARLKISAGVEKTLAIAHRHFSSTFDMLEEPENSEKFETLLKDLKKLGKQEGCDEVDQQARDYEDFIRPVVPNGMTLGDLWLVTANEAKKNNSKVYVAMEAILMCRSISEYKKLVDFVSRSDIKRFIKSNIKFFGKIRVSPGVEKMLETVYKHYPSASVLYTVPRDNAKFVSFMKDVAKWGKQKNCDEIMDYDKGRKIFDLPELDDLTYPEWIDVLGFKMNKKNPVAYKGWEASWLCNLLWENPIYLGFMKN